MELKRVTQTEAEQISDKVYACMETGNTGQARTIMAELRDTNLVLYSTLRTELVREYGVLL